MKTEKIDKEEVLRLLALIRKDLDGLQEDIRLMRTALEFYGEERHYSQTGPQHDPDQPRILQDRGAVARNLLDKLTVKSDGDQR